MNISIIGAGSTALAGAAYFNLKNVPCQVYVRNRIKAACWNQSPLTVRGKIDTSLYVPFTTDLKKAVEEADILMVCTHATDHEGVVEEIAPFLHDGQCLLFMNGCWGAIKACRLLSKQQDAPSISIAETANMPFIAHLSTDYKTLEFKAMKEEIGYSCLGEEGELSTLLHLMAPKVSRVASPASTSLSATNPIIHVTACLFNMTRIENGEKFHFFGDSLTPKVAAYMEACDGERIAIGKALGLSLSSLLDVLNASWGEKKENLYDALTENQSYKTVMGPTDLKGRYLSEDLPCGMGSLRDLSDMMHVDAPHIRSLVDTLSLYLGKPYTPFLTPQDLRVIKSLK